MNAAELIAQAQERPGLVARRAGIARSTVHRLGRKQTQPTLATLQEMAFALGLEVQLEIKPAAQAAAAEAARLLLDRHVQAGSAAAVAWQERFERWGLSPAEVLVNAGTLSRPAGQPGARFFRLRERVDPVELAASAGSADGQWALSGIAAHNYWLGREDAGAVLLWASSAEAAEVVATTLPEIPAEEPRCLIVVPARGAEFVDVKSHGHLRFACPLQTALDCYGLGYEPSALIAGWFDD